MTSSNFVAAFFKSVKPAAFTALWAFLSLFTGALVGWLDDVGAWFDAEAATEFPDPSVLVSAARSAFLAAIAGAFGGVIRFVQAFTGKGVVPAYNQ